MARSTATGRVAASGRTATTSRFNLRIKEGVYTGDGVDNKNISGLGFAPRLVMIKTSAQNAVWRSNQNQGDSTCVMASGSANSADMVQFLQNDGFQVGANASVNTNTQPHYYIAITGMGNQSLFRTGRYVGTGGDDRNFSDALVGFTPDIVMIKGNTAQGDSLRTVDIVGDLSTHFTGVADGSNEIQAIASNGFQLGTSARVNTSGVTYFYNLFRNYPGIIKTGTYTGTGSAGNTITGLGFQPDIVIVKSAAAQPGVLKTASMPAGDSAPLNTSATLTTGITSITSNGFVLGNSSMVNQAATTFWYMAFKTGNFQVPTGRVAV